MDNHLYPVVATLISSVSILLISIIWYIKSSILGKKTPPLPPGPRGLPIVGYLPFLAKDFFTELTELRHKYGPIFKLRLGSKLCVVISSPSLAKEVLRNQDSVFANRDNGVAAFVASYGANDIVFSETNSQWVKMRKIFVQEMMSNASLEASNNLRRDVVRKAVRHIRASVGKPVKIGQLTFRIELDVILNMLWGGETLGAAEQGETMAEEFFFVVTKLIDLLGRPNISDYFPVLARFDIQGVKKRMEGYRQSADRIFDIVIAEHKKKTSYGEIKKDFLQILLELQKNEDSHISINDTQIKAIMMDMVAGGTDTTAISVEWAMAELMNSPAVMKKAQKELSDVMGLNNMVDELHIPKLKYLEAVVKETLRLHPAIPLLIPRSPSKSSTVGGYTIPRKTMVYLNVRSIQRDPSIWDSPLEFKPERFLLDDDNSKCDFRGNHFHYLPFGSGRRICAGIPLAERMLMYLLATLLHSFDWEIPNGETLDMSEAFGTALRKATPLVGIPNPRFTG